jgi:hypothetical protein
VDVAGHADTLQIILSRELLEAHGGASTPAPASWLQADLLLLRAAAAQALVATAMQERSAELQRVVRQHARTAGLTPRARQRVRAVIDRHLAQEIVSPPSLAELAAAAGLSVHHFVRAYRHS